MPLSNASATILSASTLVIVTYIAYKYYVRLSNLKFDKGRRISISSLFIYPIKSCAGIAVSKALVSETGLAFDRWWMLVDIHGKFVTQRQEPLLALVKTHIHPNHLITPASKLPEDSVMTVTAPNMDPLYVPLKIPHPKVVIDTRVWKWNGHGLHAGKEASDWFSAYLGRSVALLRFDTDETIRVSGEKYAPDARTAFADGYPYLMASQASLDDLNARLDGQLLMNRFRPNFLLEGCTSFEEDTFVEFTVGDEPLRVFRGVKPCTRCKVTTTNQMTADVEMEPLETLKKFRSGKELCLPDDFKNDVVFGMNVVCDFSPLWYRRVSRVVSSGDQVVVLKKVDSVAALTKA